MERKQHVRVKAGVREGIGFFVNGVPFTRSHVAGWM
jgi:hypothetical protein